MTYNVLGVPGAEINASELTTKSCGGSFPATLPN